ncbi:hypothetical protein Ple7327_3623 [Pleurocapsa sp. PCC 7327]|nr:hypothetical protein [Pleurocapsa sp. PCC 7327]AFY78818.1 hypothetical protein Ple7327_3623 [Pleurocapsa sp. PCC 7327]
MVISHWDWEREGSVGGVGKVCPLIPKSLLPQGAKGLQAKA